MRIDYLRMKDRFTRIQDGIRAEIDLWSKLNPRFGVEYEFLDYPPRLQVSISLERIDRIIVEEAGIVRWFSVPHLETVVSFTPVTILAKSLMKKFKLYGFGERVGDCLIFLFRLKVISYVYDADTSGVGVGKEGIPSKENFA